MKNIFEMCELYDEQRETAVRIPVDKIVLTEKIHLKGTFNPENKEKIKDEHLIVVAKPLKNGTYQLVTGWNAYHTAKFRNLKTILCVTTNDNRRKFLANNGFFVKRSVSKTKISKKKPSTTNPENFNKTKMVLLEQIIIPDFFVKSPPKKTKIEAKAEYYRQNKKFPQAVRISGSNVLYDGYATYLAAKQLGLKCVPALVKKGKK